MLIRPRSKVVPLSVKMPNRRIVLEIRTKDEVELTPPIRLKDETYRELRIKQYGQWRTAYEIVGENEYEDQLLNGWERLTSKNGTHVWILGTGQQRT